MGILRLYLAICVVAAHSESVLPWSTHGGREAVQIFFIISGFYMQLILSGDKYKSNFDFYRSRFVRVFFPYMLALVLVISSSVVTALLFGNWLTLSTTVQSFYTKGNAGSGAVFATMTNGSLFLQDLVMFTAQNSDGALCLTSDFADSPAPLWHFLWIPQAWSIGVELTFYIIAPFLVRMLSLRALATVIGASLLARLVAYHQLGLTHDPWSYRFFPFELAHFCYGILGCRLMQHCQPTFDRVTMRSAQMCERIGLWYYLAVTIASICGLWFHCRILEFGQDHFRGIFLGGEVFYLASLSIWIVILPILFSMTRHSRLDRAVGELSYPVYLLHMTVVLCVSGFISKSGLPANLHGELSALLTVLAAVVLQVLILDKFESRRQANAIRNASHKSREETQGRAV